MNDKVCIDTNPVDIYRRWVNQIETESGRPSNLPQTVSIEEALSYPEIVMRLNHNLKILQVLFYYKKKNFIHYYQLLEILRNINFFIFIFSVLGKMLSG